MGYVSHDFYCLNCGKKGLNVWRSTGSLRSKNHRKKLYCPNCKETVNHIEITNPEQLAQFEEDFKNGVYKDEAEKSIDTCRSAGMWKNNLGTRVFKK